MRKISPEGKRQKGSRLERKFASLIRQKGLDKDARRRPLSGSEKMMRGYGDMITSLPFSFECKHQEKMDFWGWWEQARGQGSYQRPPVLVHTANFRPVMVSMDADTFLNILKEMYDYKELYEKLKEKLKEK